LAGVLTLQFVASLARLLITQFLTLRQEDLEAWEEAPEEFFQEEQLVRADERIRPATEALLCALFQRFQEAMAGVCIELLSHTLEHCPPSAQCPPPGSPPFKQLLIKEAVYLAVGVGAFELADAFKANHFDFGGWYRSVLTKEINTTDEGLKVIRRRAVWVAGEWASDVTSGHLRQLIYADIQSLLSQPDLVVGMAAAGKHQHTRTRIYIFKFTASHICTNTSSHPHLHSYTQI
jgi:hypothetical protein